MNSRREWESPSTFYHPRQEPVDGAGRFQTVLTSIALIALGYWILNLLDAWPSTVQRRLYEITVYVIPSQAIYSLQTIMARLSRLSHEDLTFRRADFGNQQAKAQALKRLIGHSPLPQAIRKVRSLSGVDNILRTIQEPGPPGLGNWDNSCYQNSILQALASLPEFQKYITQSLSLCDRLALAAATHRALAEFLAQLRDTTNSRETVWTPGVLKSMDSWNQQDAQEYFTKVLDAVEKEASRYARVLQKHVNPGLGALPGTEYGGSGATSLLDRVSLNESRAKPCQSQQKLSSEASPDPARKMRSRAATLLPYRCPVDGMFAQALICQECGFSDGYSLTQFNSLTLNLGLRGHSRLVDLLDEYTEPELVEGVECTECTKEVGDKAEKPEAGQDARADQPSPSKRPKLKPVLRTKTKQITLGRLPKDLVLHINRSIFDEYGNQRKNLSLVQFPARLQLPSRWCAPLAGDDEEEDIVATYELKCAVTHYGRHENGHYVAFGKRGKDWYCFNDEIVTKMDEEEVLSRGNVFMLFYEAVADGTTREGSQEHEVTQAGRKEAPHTRSSSSSSEEEPARPVEAVTPIVPVPTLRTASGNLKAEQGALKASPAVPAL
ncbi:hypothetical protein DV736_g5756, partial [Chaetothyriales sp. CBS 134916]